MVKQLIINKNNRRPTSEGNEDRQMTFIGRYYHALEQKGRLSIPVSFRQRLGKQGILTAGLDGCLFLFDTDAWEKMITSSITGPLTKKNVREWSRYIANNADTVTFDPQGRILLPEYLRLQAHLNKEVVIVGSVNRIEIWDQHMYHQYLEDLEQRAASIAESIEEKYE